MSFTLNFVADWTKIVIIPSSIQLFRIRSNQISCNLHLFPFSISSEFYLFLIQRGACRLVTKIFSLGRKPKAWCRFLQASKSTNAPLLIFLFNYVSIESFSLDIFFSQRKWHFSMIRLRRLQSNLKSKSWQKCTNFNHKLLKLFMYRKLVLRFFCFFFF